MVRRVDSTILETNGMDIKLRRDQKGLLSKRKESIRPCSRDSVKRDGIDAESMIQSMGSAWSPSSLVAYMPRYVSCPVFECL